MILFIYSKALLPPENEEMELSGAERSLDDDTEDTGGSIIKAQLLSKIFKSSLD